MTKRKKIQLPDGLASKVIRVIPSGQEERDREIINIVEEAIIGTSTVEECVARIQKHSDNHIRCIE